jgi:hypothetical protein
MLPGTQADPVPEAHDNLVLHYLRRIDERTERMETRLDELTTRVGRLEELVAGLHVDVSPHIPFGWTASASV